MELQGERSIPASVTTTWAALNDAEFLKSCIANCESLERTDADTLVAVVAMKVGPVSARFKGKLTISNVLAPNSYTIAFEGQGGVAGFGKGSADVALTPAGEHQTTLAYLARASVGGKIAQIGSRLIDSAASKIADDFFTAFVTQMEARGAASAAGQTTASGDLGHGADTATVPGVPGGAIR